MDASAGRLTVFDDVVRKNGYVRFFYVLYEKSPGFLKTTLLTIYGLKSYLSVNWGDRGNAEIAFFASFPNEHVVLDHLRRNLPELSATQLTIARRNCLGWAALRALPAYLASLPRLWRLADRLRRRLPFMPACRVFSTAAFYLRFRALLRRRRVAAVFIANHYAPECLALAAAAHRQGGKVLFTNHANATGTSVYVPPLYSDLAALTGQAVLDVYQQSSGQALNAVFVPPAAPQAPMRHRAAPGRPLTVGIFLTALTDMARLQALVAQLHRNARIGRILIRPHPVKLIKEDLGALCRPAGPAEDMAGTPLGDNLACCDLAICGNSTVAVEALRGGLPVFYDATLDACGHDFNGHLRHRLVLPLPGELDDAALAAAEDFYGDPAWLSRMRYFDASYRGDEAGMFHRLALAIRETLAESGLAPLLATPAGAAPEAQGQAISLAGTPQARPAASAEDAAEAKSPAARRLSG